MSRPPNNVVTMGLFAAGLGAVAFVGGYAGLTLFVGGIFSPTAAVGISFFSVGIGTVALGYAIDAYGKLQRMMTGEVNQKVAMLYAFAREVRYYMAGPHDLVGDAYYFQRILSDILTMRNMGELDEEEASRIRYAGDSLLFEMFLGGYPRQRISDALEDVLKAKRKSKRAAATTAIWAGVIVLGLGLFAEGVYIASLAPKIPDSNLKFAAYGLGFGIIGIGVTFFPLGFSEIRGMSDSKKVDDKLDKIIKKLERIEERLPER